MCDRTNTEIHYMQQEFNIHLTVERFGIKKFKVNCSLNTHFLDSTIISIPFHRNYKCNFLLFYEPLNIPNI